MSDEQKALAIIEQYCDNNGWDGSQFPRAKTIEDYYIVMSIGTVGEEEDLTTILTLTASRELYGKRWACRVPIPLCFSSVQDFSEHMDSAISNIKRAYIRSGNYFSRSCQAILNNSPVVKL